jgi:hypothetical protein
LQRASDRFGGYHEPVRIEFRRAAPGWARLTELSPGGEDWLWHYRDGGWHVVTGVQIGKPVDGMCGYVSPHVVRAFFDTACPPWPAVHARRATPAERAALVSAFRTSPVTRAQAKLRGAVLANACVSRFDPAWAGAIAEFPDTAVVVWFRRAARHWRVAYYENTTAPGQAPLAIILSLASCVGYAADRYGA